MLRIPPWIVVAVVALLAASLAGAHADHSKPKYGGMVKDANGRTYELKYTSSEISVWVDEHDSPVVLKDVVVTVMIAAEDNREVLLAPAGGNRFVARGKFKVVGKTRVYLKVMRGNEQLAQRAYILP